MTSEAKVSEVISTFTCSKDPDIEDFLKNKALVFERKAKSRTYLIFDETAMQEGEFRLLGYFSIAMQTLKIPAGTTISQIRKLDGLYAKKGEESLTEIPAYLIGQLAKNESYSRYITGDIILEYAMSVISRAQEFIGGRVVFIECQDKPPLVHFYMRNGFKAFRNDPEDCLLQMVRLIN